MQEAKRHIAVIAAGLDEEYQNSVIDGIIACAKEHDANVSCFAAFGGVISSSKYDIGEYNIYSLVNYRHFDGAILMLNTVNDPVEKKKIVDAVHNAGIPAVLVDGDEDEVFFNVAIDNNKAMREMVQHVITEHNARTVNYISGPLANPEAQARYEAFLHVMAENRMIVDARRVFFGEFRPADGEAAIRALLDSGLPMPDAIISANDAMALAAIRMLEINGYKVPEDVIVTGFDATEHARHYCPELSTVGRPLSEAGYKSCEVLLQKAEGLDPPKSTNLEAAPIFTESCGCSSKFSEDIRAYKKAVHETMDSTRSDISALNRMISELAETENIEELTRVIARFVPHLACDGFSLCLCADWNGSYASLLTDNYQIEGYTKTMLAPLVWTKENSGSVDSYLSGDMFPIAPEGGGNISYFLPLHFNERCLGYCIITGGKFPMRSRVCHSMMMNLSNSIENIRKLLHLNNVIQELDRLYVIDPLCGIYNRNGFIREADTLYHRSEDSKEPLLISFIDMDGLKIINDNYGHKEGDFALQQLAHVIRDCCTDGQICARFGGDEFIILGIGASEDEAETLEHLFNKRLADKNSIIHKPYDLSASIGTYVARAEPGVTLFNMITTADQMMYERKKRKKTSRYLRKA